MGRGQLYLPRKRSPCFRAREARNPPPKARFSWELGGALRCVLRKRGPAFLAGRVAQRPPLFTPKLSPDTEREPPAKLSLRIAPRPALLTEENGACLQLRGSRNFRESELFWAASRRSQPLLRTEESNRALSYRTGLRNPEEKRAFLEGCAAACHTCAGKRAPAFLAERAPRPSRKANFR